MSSPHVDGWLTTNSLYRLSNDTTAFVICPGHADRQRFGALCQLPEDAEIEICGAGFNDRTVKIRFGECFYFVFWRDLATAVLIEHAASASA